MNGISIKLTVLFLLTVTIHVSSFDSTTNFLISVKPVTGIELISRTSSPFIKPALLAMLLFFTPSKIAVAQEIPSIRRVTLEGVTFSSTSLLSRNTVSEISFPAFTTSTSRNSSSVEIRLPFTAVTISLTCIPASLAGASLFSKANILSISRLVAGMIPMRWIPCSSSYLGTTVTSKVLLSRSTLRDTPVAGLLRATMVKRSSKSRSLLPSISTILSPR